MAETLGRVSLQALLSFSELPLEVVGQIEREEREGGTPNCRGQLQPALCSTSLSVSSL